MFTFIFSVLLTSFICLCFFKKNFSENRYLVLLIGGGVALIATLIVNFSARGHLSTRTEVVYTKAMKTFYVPINIIKKHSQPNDINNYVINNYNYYAENAGVFAKDTTKNGRDKVPVTLIIYRWGKWNQYLQVGFMTPRGNQDYYDVDAEYFTKSSADTIAYVSKKRMYYDSKSKWITGFSLPRKTTITILHVPPTEFALIPDSLIRPIPF